ncbi:hypothetical protein FAZ69_29420 [Trinickia terrae]|uniref:Uncharacterized protein n=1 Tax=Trinickia terrae TaxID=2571161 RepID=A0A4U1HKN0_9BURK|nr:hypothetical protein [Trinickia terrae]TKC80177.1 hypothetical protein FAZ69_29420 [Trinickia terrae]
MSDPLARLPRPTLLFESPDYFLDGKVRSPLRSVSRFRSARPNTALASFAFVVLFGASVVVQRHENAAALERRDALQTVQGSVIAEGASKGGRIARNSTPAQSAKTASNAASPRTPAAPAAMLPKAVAALPPNSAPSESPHGDRRSRLLSLALARAHDGLDKNDLRKARSGIYWALSLEHDNSEALALKQELLARERSHGGA